MNAGKDGTITRKKMSGNANILPSRILAVTQAFTETDCLSVLMYKRCTKIIGICLHKPPKALVMLLS